jgi:ABC-2 type transport system permease protein
MRPILDIAQKDLLQLLREFRTFLFMLILPVLFTYMFGFAFGAFGKPGDDRLPVGYLDEDESELSRELQALLAESDVVRLEENRGTAAELDRLVSDEDLAAAIIVPSGYGKALLADREAKLLVIGDSQTAVWTTLEAEVLSAASRLEEAVRAATILEQVDRERMPFEYGMERTLAGWEDPPIGVEETTSSAVQRASGGAAAMAHFAPGMMMQFALAGLMGSAQIFVSERKSRTLQRLLTTATQKWHIVTGHYVAMLALLLIQFMMLIAFGQFALGVDYLRVPEATLLVVVATAVCVAGLGLLIGVVAAGEEQATLFSMVGMFVFSGLGGAWVPLEVTGEDFRAIGHLSPVAWGMDGLENILLRGLGFDSVVLPAAALAAYAVVFFMLAVWRLNASERG